MAAKQTRRVSIVERARPGAIECRFMPDSVDEDARTAEVVFTTGARVLRRSWDGPFIEELQVTPKAVRLERLNSGSAPLLDTHDTWELDSVIGVVERASIKSGEGRATVKFSDRNERARAAFAGVMEGVIRNVSVGYIVHKTEETEANEEGPAVRKATDWEPVELSFVPIGADAGAGVRAREVAQSNDCVVLKRAASPDQEEPMAENGKKSSGDEPDNERKAEEEKRAAEEKKAAEEAAARAAADEKSKAAAGNVESLDAAREQKVRSDMVRIARVCNIAGHPELTEEFQSKGMSLDAVHDALLDVRAKESGDDVTTQHAGGAPGSSRQSWSRAYARIGRLKEQSQSR